MCNNTWSKKHNRMVSFPIFSRTFSHKKMTCEPKSSHLLMIKKTLFLLYIVSILCFCLYIVFFAVFRKVSFTCTFLYKIIHNCDGNGFPPAIKNGPPAALSWSECDRNTVILLFYLSILRTDSAAGWLTVLRSSITAALLVVTVHPSSLSLWIAIL